jgi:adenylate cyclase
VLILEGQENCLPRNQVEARLARLKGLPADIRLACQTRVTGPIRARRLVFDADDAAQAMLGRETSTGREMKLAVLFSDLRGFTSFSEEQLPYDVVHALNRYLGAVCEPIEEHHGYIKDFLGDGIMVLFGLETDRAESPCLDAVSAALGMLRRMEEVNRYLLAHVGHEFRMGIGISYGSVVAGEVGFRLKRQFTAIGDVVNVAARLEGQTKVHATSLLVTDEVRRNLADLDCDFGRRLELSLAGKSEAVVAHEVLPRPGA